MPEKQTLKPRKTPVKTAKTTSSSDEKDIKQLRKIMQEAGFQDFILYMRSPWRIIWMNFLAGIFRGLGIVIGMTVVVGIVFWFVYWLLSNTVDFPVIGQYFEMFLEMLEHYAPETTVSGLSFR